ncbi:MAG: hypothetical protein IJB52_08310 [Clostridia bacterium]|nr:hypothetical protein [Clostridia bacterium]
MEKVVTVYSQYFLTDKAMEKVNKYLEEGWRVKSVTVVPFMCGDDVSVLFGLEK